MVEATKRPHALRSSDHRQRLERRQIPEALDERPLPPRARGVVASLELLNLEVVVQFVPQSAGFPGATDEPVLADRDKKRCLVLGELLFPQRIGHQAVIVFEIVNGARGSDGA